MALSDTGVAVEKKIERAQMRGSMSCGRYCYSFLLFYFAATACTCAQSVVKINAGPNECDVTNPPPGEQTFVIDASGNLLMNGTLSGPGCGNSCAPQDVRFAPYNPAPQGLTIQPSTVAAGTLASVPLFYNAVAATSCSVGTPTTTGTCPAVTASNGSCTGIGPSLMCSPVGATVSIPTSAALGANVSCSYTVTARCFPGSVTSATTFTVTTSP
jgi:hypothetical protein